LTLTEESSQFPGIERWNEVGDFPIILDIECIV
jgi:hypothetical protein